MRADGGSEVSRGEARRLIGDGAQLVDVRAAHEWDAGRIAGAVHMPLAELPRRAAELDPERAVVVYCRGGSRSSMAAAALAGAGYDAAKLEEGIVGWIEAGLPVEPEDGYIAESGEAAAVLQARGRESGD